METVRFDFPLKTSPFDFIVKEKATYEEGENFFLYLLVKRNLNSNDPEIISFLKREGVKVYGYAGLKDRYALTVQHVSLDRFIGKKRIVKKPGKFFAFLYLKRIKSKIKTGALLGNLFFINHHNRLFFAPPFSLNYYDSQRLGKNVARGRRLLKENPSKRSWERIFWINSYQSFLWNLTAFELLRRKIEEFNRTRGFRVLKTMRVEEGKVFHIFPYSKDREALFEFYKSLVGIRIPLVGYKVRFNPEVKSIVEKLLGKGGVSLEDFKRWRLKGDYRPLVVEVSEIKRYPKSLRFFLPKGAFATVYIKQIWLNELNL